MVEVPGELQLSGKKHKEDPATRSLRASGRVYRLEADAAAGRPFWIVVLEFDRLVEEVFASKTLWRDIDRYGRLVAQCFLPDGRRSAS